MTAGRKQLLRSLVCWRGLTKQTSGRTQSVMQPGISPGARPPIRDKPAASLGPGG